MIDQTLKCRICGSPYKFYSMKVGDQSACPRCVAEAERRYSSPTPEEEAKYDRRRRRYFRLPRW